MSRRWRVVLLVGVVFLLGGIGAKFVLDGGAAGIPFLQARHAERLLEKGNEALAHQRLEEALGYFTEVAEVSAAPERSAQAHLGIGRVQFQRDELLKAKATFEKIIRDFPDAETASLAQGYLGEVNMKILFSPVMTPRFKKVEVRPGDTLGKIAGQHGTTVALLMRANGLKNTVIRPGMHLKLPADSFRILVDKSQNTLTLKLGENIFKVYPVATGEDRITPVGQFKIVNKLVDPVWYTLGAVIPPESPENVLGSRWLGLDKKGYGIHGTRDPDSIGQHITQGCVRMYNEDVEELFAVVPTGTEVTIID